jgi:hypothetical protein
MDDSDVDMSIQAKEKAERDLFNTNEQASYIHSVYKNYAEKLKSLLVMYNGRKGELERDEASWKARDDKAQVLLEAAKKAVADATAALAASKLPKVEEKPAPEKPARNGKKPKEV